MNGNSVPRGIPRSCEFALALGGLLSLLPLLALVALLIKMTSKGAVIFSQVRVGRGGREFKIYKFRTMRAARRGVNLTSAGDNRVTTVGKWLRKLKIDELPQLMNVLRGEMSLVGPRPEVPEYVDLKNPLWQEILAARPGLTDPVTLRLRNEEHLLAAVEDKEAFYIQTLQPFKLREGAWFVRTKTWKTDLRVIFSTFVAIVLPQTAPLPSQEELRLALID